MRGRKRAELLERCKTVQRDALINSKLTLAEGKLLLHPLSRKFWTHKFTGIQDIRFPDIHHYLVGKMATIKTGYSRRKTLRVFAHL